MALHPVDHQSAAASRETLYAILGSVLVSIVLSCLLVGNPFHALAVGFADYTSTPAPAAPAPK